MEARGVHFTPTQHEANYSVTLEQHGANYATTLERLRSLLFIPRTARLHLPPHEASLLASLAPDAAVARAHELLRHFPEASMYLLLRAMPGSLLSVPFDSVFLRLVALSQALLGVSVGQVLELAVGCPVLLECEPEALAVAAAAMVEAAAACLQAKDPRALVGAMILHRPQLLWLPAEELEARMRAVEGHKGLSEAATRMSAERYASEASARKLAAWLCADPAAALVTRVQAVEGERSGGGKRLAPRWAQLDSLSDLWVYQRSQDVEGE